MYMNDDGFWLFRGLDTKFSFREATLPRIRQPSTRLQALVAESSEGHTHHTTAIYDSHCSPSSEHVTYFVALDIVIGEIKERFTVDDQDILCALSDVVLSNKPSEDSEDKVANFYELNKDLIQAEKAGFFSISFHSLLMKRRKHLLHWHNSCRRRSSTWFCQHFSACARS